jgi:cytochrome P450
MAVLFNPLDPAFLDDPYPTYARLRDEDPVHRHPAGFYVVSRHEDVAFVFKNADLFSSSMMSGARSNSLGPDVVSPVQGSLIGLDPPEHTRQRNIVSRGFTPRRIGALEPRIRSICDALIAKIEGRAGFDLVSELSVPLPVTVITELLGLPPERHDDFKRWSSELVQGPSSAMRLAEREKLIAVMAEFRAFMSGAIEERRRAPGDDLISILITAEEEGGLLTADQVIGFSTLLVVAGAETTTNLIGNAVLALAAHPALLERARGDLGFVPAVLEETLRWDSPVQLLARTATREVTVRDTQIPRGAFVMMLIGSANRDARQFPDAERFDPARDTSGHLAFGAGHHFCLGAALARLEARIALEGLLSRLPPFRIADGPVERHGSFLVRGPKALPVLFD